MNNKDNIYSADMIKESLIQARNLHRLIIVMCLSSLIFVFPHDKHKQYQEAYELLDRFEQQMPNPEVYKNYVTELANKTISLLPPMYEGEETAIVSDHDRVAYFLQSTKIDGGGLERSEKSIEQTYFPIVGFEFKAFNATLSEWYKWLNSKDIPKYLVPDYSKVSVDYNSIDIRLPGYKIDSISVSNIREVNNEKIYRFSIIVSTRKRVNRAKKVLTGIVYGTITDEMNKGAPSVFDWIKKQNTSPSILKFESNRVSFSPAISTIWNEIKNKTATESLDYLRTKRDLKSPVSIFGVQASGDVVYMVLPIIFLVLTCVLYFQLGQIVVSINECTAQLPSRFPWFPLYSSIPDFSNLSDFVSCCSYITIVILPSTFICMLIMNFPICIAIPICASLLNGFFGHKCIGYIAKLKKLSL